MKYLFVMALLTLVYLPTSAQISFGAKFSYGMMTSSEDRNLEYVNYSSATIYNLQHLKTRNCKSFGLSIYAETGHMFLMSDFMYRNCTDVFELRTKSFGSDVTDTYEESFNKIHIPLVGGIRFGNFKFGAGPIANVIISSKNDLDVMDDFTMKEKKVRLGYQFLLGYQTDAGVHINLKREINFGTFADQYQINDQVILFTKNPKFVTLELAAYF